MRLHDMLLRCAVSKLEHASDAEHPAGMWKPAPDLVCSPAERVEMRGLDEGAPHAEKVAARLELTPPQALSMCLCLSPA